MDLFFTALLVGLLTWFVSAACPMWLRWSLHFGAPIVAGFVYGLLLGDLPYGLAVGANIMMVYMGLVAVGGAVPNDLSVAGYLGVAMTMLANQPPEMGLTIAVPLGTLGMIAQNAKMSLNAIWVHKADQYAAEGNVRGIRLMNVVASQIIPFLLLAVPSFLAVYYGVGALEGFLAAVPVQVTNALITAGKLLPALGLALLFQQMFTKELIPFLIIGFTLAAYLGLNMMAISLIGVSLGLLHWVYTSRKVEQ
ncbi:MAG: PTS sugar transporter subunit IIC [Erysipelothrix sp.]|nr:PTS sugar transporter subunit IIC [Erysipelothrix sp.]